MTLELLKQLTWEDIHEIWYETYRTLCSEQVKDMETAQERFSLALKNLLEKNECPPSICMRFPVVLHAAESACGIKLSRGKSRENTTLRALVAYRLRAEGYTFKEIGKMLRRDHSSVIHLCKMVCDMLSVPNAYREEIELYEELERVLGQPRQCSQPSSQTTSASSLAESPAK